MEMKVISTEVSLKHKAFEIYVSGCRAPHCAGCHNPESWDFSKGTEVTPEWIEGIKRQIKEAGDMIENIWLLGGEPLHQALFEVANMLRELKPLNKKVWLFTRYEFGDVPRIILKYLYAVKTGAYIQEEAMENYESHGIPLASKNQRIYLTQE